MANVWQGLPPLGRSPDAAAYAARSRRRRNQLTVLAALGVVVAVGATSYVGVQLWDSFTLSIANIGQGFERLGQSIEIGGTSANAAASVASSQPPGSLTVASLNAARPKYRWVDGATAVPESTLRRPVVGVNIVGTDIETAAQVAPGLCSHGLSVASSSDPLIAEDHLPGPGTYYQIQNAPYQVQNAPCVADQVPASSWIGWMGTP